MAEQTDREHFPPHSDPRSLTVADLLEARDRYHAALAKMENVVATAVGYYLMRDEDTPRLGRRASGTQPRTLDNSRVRSGSWPAVLVLVRDWEEHGSTHLLAEHVIPQYLYLANGRLVPTCIIKIALDDEALPPLAPGDVHYPGALIGGGCGVYTQVQGDDHVGTVSCLVTDGERAFALTCSHVCGPPGQPVFTRRHGKRECVGASHPNQAKKMRFSELYAGYPGDDELSNVDAGLVEVYDLNHWTAQVLGLGELGDVADLHPGSITLGLIGWSLRASGAASGHDVKGQILGLFPRYRTMGGVDCLGDVLIAPRTRSRPHLLKPGDSGALWVVDPKRKPEKHMGRRPLAEREAGHAARVAPVAVSWGAMDLHQGGRSYQVVFGSFLSSVCKLLDVQLVTGHNVGYYPIWGAENHRTIAGLAGSVLAKKRSSLASLLAGNADRLEMLERLAVLPDEWGDRFGSEVPSHIGHIDLACNGGVLGEQQVSPTVWREAYRVAKRSPAGCLPFRVGQVFDEMVQFRQDGSLNDFFSAAGVIAHYVADACNPVHISVLGKGKRGWQSGQKRFHDLWDKWPDVAGCEDAVQRHVSGKKPKLYETGQEAAEAVVRLSRLAARTVDLKEIVSSSPTKSLDRAATFQSQEGPKALKKILPEACELLLSLWQSAWEVGSRGAPRVSDQEAEAIDVSRLHARALASKTFLKSHALKYYADQEAAAGNGD